ncbi:MAG: hypothetical protein ACI8XC_004513, partial [Gammaproteobacteria bacterium]
GDKYKFDNLYQPEYTYLDGQNRIEINF